MTWNKEKLTRTENTQMKKKNIQTGMSDMYKCDIGIHRRKKIYLVT